MKIQLEPHEAEKILHTALCNGLGELAYYSVKEDTKKEIYDSAKSRLKSNGNNIFYEDVLLEVIKHEGKLDFVEDLYEDQKHSIKLSDVHNMGDIVPVGIIMAFINEEDDADTADTLLQYLLFGEVTYG